MKKIVLSVILILLVGVSLFSLRMFASPTHIDKPIHHLNVGLSWKHEAQFAGEYYADIHKLYKAEGLEVSLIPYNDTDLVEDLLNKKIDIAILQGDALLTARSKGKPVVGIFVTYRKSPTIFYAKPQSGITSPQDFVGKKIGVAYSEKIPLLAMLEFTKVDKSKVTFIDREYSYEPLAKGIYDVEAGWITDLDSIKKAGIIDPIIIPAADYGGNIYADILSTTNESIKTSPDIIKKFVKATNLGWENALKDLKASALLTKQYDQSLDPTHLEFVLKVSEPYIKITADTKVGSSAFAQWKNSYEILKKQGLIEKDFNITDAYDPSFIDDN